MTAADDSSSIAKNSCVKSVVSVHSAEFYGTSHSPKAPPFMSTTEKNLKESNLTDFCMGVAFLVPLQQWMNVWKYLGEGNIQINIINQIKSISTVGVNRYRRRSAAPNRFVVTVRRREREERQRDKQK